MKAYEVQREAGVDITEDDVHNGIKIGLVEVVYEWSRGMSFKNITGLTDVLEGIFKITTIH
jgi:antiviral helicase SKI2